MSSRRSPASSARPSPSSAGAASAAAWPGAICRPLGSAFIWASYSLLTRRVAHFPTAVVGLFGLVSGGLALLCHLVFEPRVELSLRDWGLIVAVGVGPLGAAFFLWDAALKRGDARRIGILSYLTPLASTLLLVATSGRPLTVWIGLAAVLIVGAAIAGVRAH
jgi:drug/metabolite transporter (DMT)-like permease